MDMGWRFMYNVLRETCKFNIKDVMKLYMIRGVCIMNKLVISLLIILALVMGISIGGMLALKQKYTIQNTVKEEVKSEGKAETKVEESSVGEVKEDKSEVKKVVKEEEKSDIKENARIRKKSIQKEENFRNDPSENDVVGVPEGFKMLNDGSRISKDYKVYYYAAEFIEKGSDKYISLDMIYMHDSIDHPNDYYIANDNNKLRTYKLAKDANIRILEMGDYNRPRNVSFDDFATNVLSSDFNGPILDVNIRNNEIVSIKEVFVP